MKNAVLHDFVFLAPPAWTNFSVLYDLFENGRCRKKAHASHQVKRTGEIRRCASMTEKSYRTENSGQEAAPGTQNRTEPKILANLRPYLRDGYPGWTSR